MLVGDLASLNADKPSRTEVTRDPDDDYLVALARSTSVDYLVSGDRDFLDLADPHPPVLSPTVFLDLLTATP